VNRLSRDVSIAVGGAVAGGAILSIIAAFTTHLTRLQLVKVGVATLAACALILGGSLVIASIVRRRWATFKARIVTTVTEAVLSKLDSHIARQIEGMPKTSAINAATDRPATLPNLLEEGRVLHARLAERDDSAVVAPELGVEIARWEARSFNALMVQVSPSLADDFNRQSLDNVFDMTGFKMYYRLSYELQTIERAIREGIEPPPNTAAVDRYGHGSRAACRR
jgi:hypothetical protein